VSVEVLAGGSVGPMTGRLAYVTVEIVELANWASKIVDTARDGAALVAVETGAIDFYRDGGQVQTGAAGSRATPGTDVNGHLQLGPGDWALLGQGAAFHFGAVDQEIGATALVVTVSPNAAVVEEHEMDAGGAIPATATPVPSETARRGE
jgi:hypothetical protein